jgi:ribokinase
MGRFILKGSDSLKILNFGSLSLNKVYAVESFTRPGVIALSKHYQICPGGKGLNQSIAIARAGSEVYHAGKTGPDGALLTAALRENGVKTDFVLNNGTLSGHAFVQVNRYGNQCALVHGGANLEIERQDIDSVFQHFSAGDMLILQNEINNLPYIIHSARQKQMILVLNPSPVTDSLAALDLHKINYLILNESEGHEITGEHRPNKILSFLLGRYPRLKVVLTLGQNGSFYGDEMHRLRQNAFVVNAVDTTAAGDTFLGFFLSRIAMGRPVWNALRTASIAAAITITQKGASASIPYWEDVLCFGAAV